MGDRRADPGNEDPAGAVGTDVQRWNNGLKTALLLGLMGGLILGAGALIGGRSGLLIALVGLVTLIVLIVLVVLVALIGLIVGSLLPLKALLDVGVLFRLPTDDARAAVNHKTEPRRLRRLQLFDFGKTSLLSENYGRQKEENY